MIFDLLDQYFLVLEDKISLPEDQLKVVFSWLVCIPLGFFMKLLKDPFIRNLYGLALGLFLQYLCQREFLFVSLAASLFVWFLVKVLGKKADWPSFFFLYALLLGCHIRRFIIDYYGWKIGGETVLMIMLCKMTYFTFGYADGKVKMPTLLEYLGYLYFFPSAIVGPVFKIQTYLNFINLKDQYSKIPSTLKSCLWQVLFGVSYLVLLQILGPYLEPKVVIGQQWYLELNVILKFLLWHPMLFAVQVRYLGAWKFAQAGMNACGISFSSINKDTKEPEFNEVVTVQDSFLIEYNPITITSKWNSSVQLWVKEVFYERLNKSFPPQTALLLCFTISGIWHGVHPMYFISFIHFAIYGDVAKFIYRARDKLKWIPKPVAFVLKWFCGKTCVNYFGIGFNLLELSVVHQVYSSVYYSFTIIPLLLHIFFTVTRYGQRSNKKKIPSTPGEQSKPTVAGKEAKKEQ